MTPLKPATSMTTAAVAATSNSPNPHPRSRIWGASVDPNADEWMKRLRTLCKDSPALRSRF
jgi:hypothetical protein